MEKFTAILLAELNAELQQIVVTSENKLQQAERSFNTAEKAISKLREYILSYSFKSTDEEIKFFKEIKPEFQKELIYNEELLFIESNCPVGSQKARKVFMDRTLSRIQAYFEKHSYIYNYCRSGENSFDTLYFVRFPKPIPLVPVSYSDLDPEFSNPHSYKVAKLKAFEYLRDYISAGQTSMADGTEVHEQKQDESERKMTFTGPAAALEEMLQGWIAKGWINFGDYPAKKLFLNMGLALQIKLGDPSRGLIGMALRKNGYTPHIDKMKVALIDKVEKKHQ